MAAPTTDVDICNLALDLLKQNKTVVADITTTPTSEEEITCARWYHATREALLRSHNWIFAKKRAEAILRRVSITGATQANPVVITATAHSFLDGDAIRINSVVGMTELNGNSYLIANKTANTFELTDLEGTNIDGTGFTAYTSGGLATPFSFGYADTYTLPTDFLRLEFVGDDSTFAFKEDFIVEGTNLLITNSNVPLLKIGYIRNETDVAKFDSLFVVLLAAELANNMAYKWTLKNTVIERLEAILEQRREEAKLIYED